MTEQEAAQAAGEQQPTTYKIGDQEFDEPTLSELISKGTDYTKKTQELATERKELDDLKNRYGEYAKFGEIWETQPHQREAIVKHFAKEAGVQLGSVPTTSANPEDWDSWSPEMRTVYTDNQALKKQLSDVNATLGDVKGFIGEQRKKDQLDYAMTQAQSSLKTDLGVEVSVEELRAAVRKTKIEDPEAAWLKTNKGGLKEAFIKNNPAIADKPNTPTPTAKTFDPYEKNAEGKPLRTADEIDQLIADGVKPTQGPSSFRA